MEHAFIFVGVVAIWAFLSSRANNPNLKALLYFQTILFTMGIGWLSWYIEANTLLQGLEIFRYMIITMTFAFLFSWGGFWMAGALEEEEIDNGF